MTSLTDQQLLRDYAASRSEPAFAELARRHVDLVYSAAVRMVRDAHLAEDVTQGVFLALAQNARSLADRSVLSGWLHRTALNLASKAVRSDVRRRAREQEAAVMNELQDHKPGDAWEHIAPHLDTVIGELNEPDRDALLLRYFERKSAQEMAQTLGISAEAAQKRVNRAVDRLRELFARRGITASAGGLVTVVSANAVQAAPAGLVATISTAAGTAVLTSSLITTTKAIAMTTLQKIIVAAVVAVGVATPLLIQHRSHIKLRDENRILREQLKQETQLASENERLTGLLEQVARTNTQSLPKEQFNELLRLRSEVGRLRAETKNLAQLRAAENQSNPLRAKLEQMPEKSIPELQLLDEKKWAEDASRKKMDSDEDVREALAGLRRAAKISFSIRLASALNDFTTANNGQLPNDLSELKPFLKFPADEQLTNLDSILQRYELLHTGKLNALPPSEPLVTEKAPVDEQYDTLFKIGANWYTDQGVGKWSNQPASTNSLASFK